MPELRRSPCYHLVAPRPQGVNPVARLDDLLRLPGRRHRRVASSAGVLHIEVRAGRRPGSEAMLRRLHKELAAAQGVNWAEVDGILGRVVVSFDDDAIEPDDIVDMVTAVEEAHGNGDETFGFDREDHPAFRIGSQRALIALLADAAGLGVSLAGSILRLTPLPVELASAVSLVDSTPRLRRLIEHRIGASAAYSVLALGNATAQGLGSGPFGLLVDALQRATALSEARAEEHCFELHADSLQRPGNVIGPVERRPRPSPLPSGPIERYVDRAAPASLVAAGLTFAATLDPRRAATMMLAGMAKPAKLGREAFAAQLGRVLSRRGIVTHDPAALRRLDRIDTVLVEASCVLSASVVIDRVLLTELADHIEVHRHIATHFDGTDPGRVKRRGGWALGPASELAVARKKGARALLRQLGSQKAYAVLRRDELMALFTVRPELAPGARELAAAVRASGYMFAIAGNDLSVVDELGAHILVPGGREMADSVRGLQEDECAVALVAGTAEAAHAAADFGIGLRDGAGEFARACDVLCSNGLIEAELLIAAAAVAHEVSRQSATLALAGSSIGAALALINPVNIAGARAMTAVNGASLISMANGTRAGLALRHRRSTEPPSPAWHELTSAEVLQALVSGPGGLDAKTAGERIVAPEKDPSVVSLLTRSVVEELANPLTPVLAGGSLLAATVGSTLDAVLVASVAATGSILGGVQRFGAQRAVAALAHSSAPTARVRRDGEATAVEADDLVPGDVVLLEAGDAVPADCRVLEATNLEVDESSLTGESAPVAKDQLPVFAPSLADRTCMIYEGTTIAAGEAVAVAVAVGPATVANTDIWSALGPSPAGGVEHRLRELAAMTIPVAAAGGGAILASGFLRGQPISATIGPAVSLAVAAIPEGLPVLATAAQLAAARRLAARNTVVRAPRAIEALGRVQVLCIDKTGTLTKGRIELHSVVCGDRGRPLDSLGPAHRRVLAAAVRASPARERSRTLPHMTDEAIVRGAISLGIEEGFGLDSWERGDELPFESSRGYHATAGVAQSAQVLTVKGAPEDLVGRCEFRLGPGGRRLPMSRSGRRAVVAQVDRLARGGLRVLAVAERTTEAGNLAVPECLGDAELSGLTLLGLVTLADPVRETAAGAVAGIRAAGVDVVMVTGDHPSTAEGIAAELGILDGRHVVTGAELDRLSDDQLDAKLPQISVFARVSPPDKVRIVAAYQRAGLPVAMTGDGANDAAAIRLADVGLALGERCTPAARDAADIVIADGRVETIVDAIIEGRALWAAVRDAIAILLGGNLGEVVFTAGTTVLTGRSPLNARQLLLVNLLTDIAPALTIAVRQPTGRTPQQLAAEGPELSLGAPLRRKIALRAVTTASGAAAAWSIASTRGRPRRASTTALVALVGTQLGQTIASSWTDPLTVGVALGSAALLCATVQTPVVSSLFGCVPLGPVAWATAVGSASAATAAGVMIPIALRRLR